ncbi:hypothetical protein KC960_00100 [Candidatus Saccharibacteria bacterium]|nr:hypothetical protein [Candidatus Saccharibacteria bacterium]
MSERIKSRLSKINDRKLLLVALILIGSIDAALFISSIIDHDWSMAFGTFFVDGSLLLVIYITYKSEKNRDINND